MLCSLWIKRAEGLFLDVPADEPRHEVLGEDISVRAGRVLGAGLWSPFFNFHFGGAETGSIAERDRFAERPWGGLVGAAAATINERAFVFRRMHHRGHAMTAWQVCLEPDGLPGLLLSDRGPVNCSVQWRAEPMHGAQVSAGKNRRSGSGAPPQLRRWHCHVGNVPMKISV
jgi:hypothetical protein